MHFIKSLINLVLPSCCVLCGAAGITEHDLCLACATELPCLENHHTCQQCADILPIPSEHCGNCLKQSPAYDRTIALYHYQTPLTSLITRLKFSADLKQANLLGQLLAEKLLIFYQQQALPDVIIPMPLHIRRLQERGFNQSVELARPITKQLCIPLELHACQRIRATSAQINLPSSLRQKNLHNAFIVNTRLQRKHVAILDDVITTGASVQALSQALRQQGVTQIDVWCIARTQRKS